MNIRYFRRIEGLIRRWYRKNFHKNWEVVEHGLDFFQEFADIYGDTINDIETADLFFKDLWVKLVDGLSWISLIAITGTVSEKLMWINRTG